MIKFLLGLIGGAFIRDLFHICAGVYPSSQQAIDLTIKREGSRWKVVDSNGTAKPIKIRSGGTVTWTLQAGSQVHPTYAVLQLDPDVFTLGSPESPNRYGVVALSDATPGGVNTATALVKNRNIGKGPFGAGGYVEYELSYSVTCFEVMNDTVPDIDIISEAAVGGDLVGLLNGMKGVIAVGSSPPRMIIM